MKKWMLMCGCESKGEEDLQGTMLEDMRGLGESEEARYEEWDAEVEIRERRISDGMLRLPDRSIEVGKERGETCHVLSTAVPLT